MKVLILDQIASVNFKYSFSLANALMDAGCRVEMVTDGIGDSAYCRCPCHRRFLTSRKDIGKLRKALNYLSVWRWVLRKARKERFDIVHLEWFSLSPADAFFLSRLVRKGICPVAGVHDILPFDQKRFDLYFYRKIYARCSRIFVQAQPNVARFQALFPELRDRVSLIPHGHFLDFAAPIPSDEARARLGIPGDKTVFLFFGQIKKVKGLDVLLTAFGQLCKRREGLFLAVAGSVWKDDFSVYRELIDRFGLDESVLKTDIRYIPEEELSAYYSACDVCVLPYRDVYQSGVLQLVYAYGKPAVATAIPSFEEFVSEGESGFLCAPGDPESLSLAMERAADRKDQWAAMGARGREKVRQALSWDRIGARVAGLYEEALADFRQKKGQ